MVWAYDEETGENAWKPVVRLFRNQTREWYHVFVDGEEIVCTGGHPFYVVGEGFVEAKDLKTSDKLLLSSGKCVTIEEIQVEQLFEPETTYNFEVADFHTYYVSESNVLVHNECWDTIRRNYWKERAESPDAEFYNTLNENNTKLLKKGLAPYGADGKKVELHHVYGRQGDYKYIFVEMTHTNHVKFHKMYKYKGFTTSVFDTEIFIGAFAP